MAAAVRIEAVNLTLDIVISIVDFDFGVRQPALSEIRFVVHFQFGFGLFDRQPLFA